MFKNASKLGSFGEFVYKCFAESQGFICHRTNFCHTDFLVTPQNGGQETFVDVKSTQKQSFGYRGKRFHNEIAYETIVVFDGTVSLIPDPKSPFYDRGRLTLGLGSLDSLLQKWHANPRSQNKKTALNEHLYEELKAIFASSKFPKVRFVERGDASSKRWTGTVDNLPGSNAIIEKADATVFIQYGCSSFNQVISKIMIFPHDLIRRGGIRMLEPNARQKNKGILEVVDLNSFAEDFPNLVFSSVESVKRFINTL